MYCVSVARLLASIGIQDFLIYGLATHGPKGTLCAAWVNPDTEYDLTNEEDILQFMIFVLKLRKVAADLLHKYTEVKESLLQRIEDK
ncbi:hypothetical protein C8T65DRAFT_544765, partial [Cerioporus squamosus]